MSSTDPYPLANGTEDRVWVDSLGDAWAAYHPEDPETSNAHPYRRDDPDDPLVRLSEVEVLIAKAIADEWDAYPDGCGPNTFIAAVLLRIRRNLHQPTEDRQEGSSDA